MTTAFLQLHPGEVTAHPPQQFYAGDTWEIAASVEDGDGNKINLAGAVIIWRLNNSANVNVLELTVGNGIALTEDVSGDLIAGECFITVPAQKSGPLPVGFYVDELTVEVGDKVLTQFRGRIEVLRKLAQSVSGGISGGS
jgi:hypothetical protein